MVPAYVSEVALQTSQGDSDDVSVTQVFPTWLARHLNPQFMNPIDILLGQFGDMSTKTKVAHFPIRFNDTKTHLMLWLLHQAFPRLSKSSCLFFRTDDSRTACNDHG